jgi:hypothetical protein
MQIGDDLFESVVDGPLVVDSGSMVTNPSVSGLGSSGWDTVTSDISEGPRYIGRDPDSGDGGGGVDGRITL